MKSKRDTSFALGIVFLVSGGVALAISSWTTKHAFEFQTAGLLLVISSVYLVRKSKLRSGEGRMPPPAVAGPNEKPRVSKTMWVLSVLSVVGTAIAFLFLYMDALGGYHQFWPLYAFALAGAICAGVLGFLAAKLMS